jgi:hypothetical protein
VLPVFIEVIASHGAGSIAWTVTAALPPGDGVTTFIGEVTKISGDHLRAVAGETGIILLTGAGLVELTATPATVVRIPAGPNLVQENRAAVSTAGGRVLHLMVLPDRPVTSVHFTGVVVPSPASSSGDAFLTLRDRQGNQVSAALPPDIAEPPIRTLATAILSRPSYGGELRITGLDTAAASLDRVSTALERAKAACGAEALARLSRGLAATAKSRLILLDEASQWPEPSLAGGARAEFAMLRQAYEETLARYESSPVLLEVDGIITSLGPKTAQEREMTVGSKWGRWNYMYPRGPAFGLALLERPLKRWRDGSMGWPVLKTTPVNMAGPRSASINYIWGAGWSPPTILDPVRRPGSRPRRPVKWRTAWAGGCYLWRQWAR